MNDIVECLCILKEYANDIVECVHVLEEREHDFLNKKARTAGIRMKNILYLIFL